MVDYIQTLLQGVNKKQAGLGVVAFCGGFGLGVYLNRRGKISFVVEPEHSDATADLNEIEEAYEEALSDVYLSEEDSERIEANNDDPVIFPPKPDPSVIAVDLEAVRRRDELIGIYGFTEGMRLYQDEYSTGTDIPTEDDEDSINIFASEDDGWNQEDEDRIRSESDEPYILHKDEFWGDEKGYTQNTLTYYAGDNTLCSEDSTPIYNIQEVVGELKFGHGSGDRNVAYVRNDKLKAEYEVIRDRGHFSVEVLGLVEEEAQERAQLKHSLRKFRPDD